MSACALTGLIAYPLVTSSCALTGLIAYSIFLITFTATVFTNAPIVAIAYALMDRSMSDKSKLPKGPALPTGKE